jgi:hypothetical protein
LVQKQPQQLVQKDLMEIIKHLRYEMILLYLFLINNELFSLIITTKRYVKNKKSLILFIFNLFD